MDRPTPAALCASAPDSAQRWRVAYSGGLDSTVLLHLAWASGWPVRAVHIHHGLQADADAWVEHCRQVCAGLGVSLDVVYVSLRPQGEGVEAAARTARYQALAEGCQADECVLSAHHADDQAETLLLRLMRGSGVRGAAGIAAARALGAGMLYRPLLGYSRAVLLDYAKQHGLNWIEDPSNATTEFDRGVVRHQVLPILSQRWPAASATLARFAQHARDSQALIDSLIAPILSACEVQAGGPLSVSALVQHPVMVQQAIVRAWISADARRVPSQRRLAAGLKALLHAGADRQPLLRWADGTIQRHQDALYRLPRHWPAVPGRQAIQPAFWQPWGSFGQVYWSLPDDDVSRAAGDRGEPWFVRAGQPGDRLVSKARPRQRLAEVMRQRGMAPWWRSRWPVVVDAADTVHGLAAFKPAAIPDGGDWFASGF